MDLQSRATDTYSQNGEDGILAAIFEELGVSNGYFVEFGAWDGMQYSNAYGLVRQGWTGCFIEGDPARYAELVCNVPQAEVAKVCRFVQASGPDGLDAILTEVGARPEFELLSIDIDSDDLAVWRGLRSFRPLCVVIEYNPTIPFDVRFENPPNRNWGNAARSICDFATDTGYRLVAVTATNAVFLDERSDRDSARVPGITLDQVEPQLRYFWGYDGSLITLSAASGQACAPEFYRVPWVGTVVAQPVPAWLRRYDDSGSAARRAAKLFLTAGTALARPVSASRTLRARLRLGIRPERG